MSYEMPIAEHETRTEREKPTQASSYMPTPEEQRVIKKCEGLLQKAKKARKRYDYGWLDFYKLLRGKQWKEIRPAFKCSEVYNLIWEVIQSQVPLVVDQRPRFEYLPTEPSDRPFAELMNKVSESDWERQNWLFTVCEMVYDSHTYGTAFGCMKFNPHEDEIEFHCTSPFYLFIDPSAQSFKYRCSYAIHCEPVDTDRLKALVPEDKRSAISPDVNNFASDKNVDLTTDRQAISANDRMNMTLVNGSDHGNAASETLVSTYYYDDHELEDEESELGEEPREPRLKYPKGRKTVIANGMILDDGQNDCPGDIKYPWSRLVNYMQSRQFYGVGEVEPLEAQQRSFNRMVSYACDVLYLMGNPIWVVSTDSSVDTDNLTNQPGLVVEKTPGSEVRREEGVQLQPYVLQFIDRLKEWFERNAGSQDVSRGSTPGSVTAMGAITALQEAAQTRIRLKTKNLDACMQDLGQNYAQLVMEYYTAPKVFRLTGDNGAQEFFKMHIETDEASGQKKAIVRRFSETGQELPGHEEYVLKGKLDVRVTTGSSLPFNKSQNEQRAFALFDRKAIDLEQLLTDLDYPNKDAIIERMQAQQAAAQQAQAVGQPPQGVAPAA